MSKIYFSTFDENGIRTATYLEDIHGKENIPTEAVALNEEEWALYCSGEYKRNIETGKPEKIMPEPIILTPEQKRAYDYANRITKEDGTILIEWDSNKITVDHANKIYLEYSIEGSPKATEMQALIISAKEYIRSLYPDIKEER